MKNRKSISKIYALSAIFTLILTLSFQWIPIHIMNFEDNNEICDKTIRISYFNNSASPILIIGNATGVGAQNWSWAEEQPWCTLRGDGIYYIENLTINAQNSDNGIEIRHSNVKFRIKNCTVFNSIVGLFTGGIVLMNVNNSELIDNNCSNNNGHGIFLGGSNNNSITGNVLNNNKGAASVGILLFRNCDKNNITRNIANNNTWSGITLSGSSNNGSRYNNIIENMANYNGEHGIHIDYHSDNNSIQNNNACYNSADGIQIVVSSHNNSIQNNIACYNDQSGIHIDNKSNNTIVYGNNASSNLQNGIHQEDECCNSIIIGNTVNNNSIDGIKLYSNSHNNSVRNNIACYNDQSGIHISSQCKDMIVFGNNASSNVKNGISLDDNCFYNDITKNIANENYESGIFFDLNCENNTISRNTASNNTIHGIHVTDNCYYNNITRNIINMNLQSGIFFDSDCINSIISENTIMNNSQHGINFYSSCNGNTITKNIIQENSKGIILTNSGSNDIFFNAFIKNLIHAEDTGIGNQWNGVICGNYWDNHSLDDSDHDGITNSGYNSIAGNLVEDNLPLWQSPIHLGGKIHIDGMSASAPNWSRTALLTIWCFGSGSFLDPYCIGNLEINANFSGSGILIENSNKFAWIENCIVLNANDSESDAGIRVENSHNLTIIDNICFNNANNGIFFGGGSKNNSIINNHIEGSFTKVGISLADNCNNNTIYNNTILSTGVNTTGIGIFLFVNCCYNDILENSIINNFGIGISLSDHCNYNTLSQNIVVNNGLHGIQLVGQCDENDILINEIIQNAMHGIFLLDNCDYNTISENTANENENGILLQTYCSNNTISGNTADNNRQNGIYLNEWCDDNIIMSNTESFNGNGFCGILLEGCWRNEIFNNNAHENEYGIGLINSYLNIISFNKLWSNLEGWIYCEGDCINGNTFLNNEIYAPGELTPPNYIGIIITIIIICSLVIAISGVYAYKRKQKVITVQSKGDSDKMAQKAITSEQAIGLKKKKHKVYDTPPISLDLTKKEKKEIEQTESELGIEKSEFICIVHKGTIDGAVYICPNCKTFYCVRCANALKDKGEKCWSCESDINVTITDNIISEKEQKIQELKSRMDSIKTTVQTLDESFYSGAISQEIYSQSRDPLMKKITALIEEIEQLKSQNK